MIFESQKCLLRWKVSKYSVVRRVCHQEAQVPRLRGDVLHAQDVEPEGLGPEEPNVGYSEYKVGDNT